MTSLLDNQTTNILSAKLCSNVVHILYSGISWTEILFHVNLRNKTGKIFNFYVEFKKKN